MTTPDDEFPYQPFVVAPEMGLEGIPAVLCALPQESCVDEQGLNFVYLYRTPEGEVKETVRHPKGIAFYIPPDPDPRFDAALMWNPCSQDQSYDELAEELGME